MKKTRLLLLAQSIFPFFFPSCGKQPQADLPPQQADQRLAPRLIRPPEITSEMEEDGFIDLVLYIQEHTKIADGSQSIRVAGVHKGTRLGFEVILGANWKRGTLGQDVPLVTHQGIVTYRSIGADSDAFVRTLDSLYGTKQELKKIQTDVEFTAISLQGDPGELDKGAVRIKLFYEGSGDDSYAEVYLNIDLSAKRLEFHEKDPDYRKQLVSAFKQSESLT